MIKSTRVRQLAGILCPNPLLRNGIRLDDALGAGFGVDAAVVVMTRGGRGDPPERCAAFPLATAAVPR